MIQTYLAFDYGTKRIGVAIGNNLTLQARGLTTIINNKDGSTNWQTITMLLSQYQIFKIIVGLPINTDGSEQLMTKKARNFAKKLVNKFNIEVILVDESFTSNQARKDLKYNYLHSNANKKLIDKRSAELILEQYFNDECSTIKKQ